MNRTHALLSCGLVVGLLGVAGCGSSSNTSSGSGGPSSSDAAAQSSAGSAGGSPIKIGIMEPTSGALASLAKQIVNSGKYAVAYVNAHGGVNGRPLKLLTYNTQLDPATAATDYEQAATQDHVVAVLGPLISPEVNAALPVAQRTQTPMLLPGAADIVFTKPVKQYVFRVGSNESQDDAAMAALAKHLGCTKPALLYDNGALGLSTQSDIAKDIPHFTVSVESSATATDLTPELQKIRQAGAQCIIEGSDDLGGVGSMVATMANTGYKVPIMGDSALTLAPFVATAGAAVNTVPVYGTDVFNPDSSFFKHLYAGYVKQYGTVPPGEEIGTTWDSVQILATALKADGGKGGSALASALQNVSGSSLTSLIGHGGATPSFSATSHDWVPPAQDRMYRVLPGSPKLVATGVGG